MLDAEDPELLIQVLMSNIIHFGIKIVSIDYQEGEGYELKRIMPQFEHINLTEHQSYSSVIGLKPKNTLKPVDKSAAGQLIIIWKPLGEISEGGVLYHNLSYKSKAGFEELTLLCNTKKIEYGESAMINVKIRNNTNLLQHIRVGNKEDRNCPIGIHTIDVDYIKLDPKKETSIEILTFGRKKGIHKLKNLKLHYEKSNKNVVYEPLEFEVI